MGSFGDSELKDLFSFRNTSLRQRFCKHNHQAGQKCQDNLGIGLKSHSLRYFSHTCKSQLLLLFVHVCGRKIYVKTRKLESGPWKWGKASLNGVRDCSRCMWSENGGGITSVERSKQESGQGDGEGRLGESSGEGNRCMNKSTRKPNTF